MAETCDEWAGKGTQEPLEHQAGVVQMQSEAGVAGTIHGMLQTGSLTTTFTASQGLLLMIPNLYKIAGELLPFCLHVTARTIATHALSIFGDHSDVMACRQAGVAMLASNSPQEAQDLPHRALRHARIPRAVPAFLRRVPDFARGSKIHPLPDAALRGMIKEESIRAFRDRALTPDRPAIRGTAQNPDVFFQAREACNPYYSRIPAIVRSSWNTSRADRTQISLFDYTGHPEADRVIIAIGSGTETVRGNAAHLNAKGETRRAC